MRLIYLLTLALLAPESGRRVISVPSIQPVGPYSLGIVAGEYLYVSGQGARDSSGQIPAGAAEQARASLNNVRSIVEAAGLTMEHVVYTQVYLKDMADYDTMDRAFAAAFPHNPPARAVLGVTRMPGDTPIEINAVAVRDVARKKAVEAGGHRGILTHDRFYLPGILGRDPKTASDEVLDAAGRLLKAAGLGFGHVVFVNPYLTDGLSMEVMNRAYARRFEFGYTPARATIRVASLPQGAVFEMTGVAVRDLRERRVVRPKNMAPSPTASPCVFAGDTLFCSAKSAFIPGPNSGIYAAEVEHQVRQSMRNLLDGLEEGGLDFSHVVASNVYVDSIDEFPRMNKVYGEYFRGAPPTRTTVQPLPPVERKPDARGRWPMIEQVSVIAVR